jgi:hypothetical protein
MEFSTIGDSSLIDAKILRPSEIIELIEKHRKTLVLSVSFTDMKSQTFVFHIKCLNGLIIDEGDTVRNALALGELFGEKIALYPFKPQETYSFFVEWNEFLDAIKKHVSNFPHSKSTTLSLNLDLTGDEYTIALSKQHLLFAEQYLLNKDSVLLTDILVRSTSVYDSIESLAYLNDFNLLTWGNYAES